MDKTPNILKLYKETFSKKQTEIEVNFLIKKLILNKNDTIIDLACGYGRHAIELAKLGYKISGYDFNLHFIKDGINKSKLEKLDVQFYLKDLRYLIEYSKFNKAYLLYSYFSLDDYLLIFQNIYNILTSDSFFCFDVPNKSYFNIMRKYIL